MSDTSLPRRPAKVGHKKSRTGCQQCRVRRVKCDEARPTCASCARHQAPCIYDRGDATPTELTESPGTAMTGPSSASVLAPTSLSTSLPISDLPETRHRRLLELRLLHQWVTKTALSLSTDAALGKPIIVFGNDSTLYMLYSVSALNLARYEPDNFELKEAYRQYFDVGLRKHSVEVNDLSKANVDVICMTSSLIRVSPFASLQERNLEPYTPPIQWIQVAYPGAGRSFKAAVELSGDSEGSLSLHARMYKRVQGSSDWGSLFAESNCQGLIHLLRPARHPAAEPWDAKIEQASKSTLGLICSGQPRALVLIAYYFALLTSFNHVWWIGDTGKREIIGIRSFLSTEKSYLMR
ncbi:hypothetical protein V8E51_010928 [Hyaloscypha variabilis]